MKHCSKCRTEKPRSEFYTKNGRPHSWCKQCCVASSLAHQKKNRERHNAQTRAHKDRNREAIRAYNSDYRKNNREIIRASKRSYMRRRKARLSDATPPWADLDAIRDFYQQCPAGFCVDHIVPVNHPQVSGLHVRENLQYLPERMSLLKGNQFDGTQENRSWLSNSPD